MIDKETTNIGSHALLVTKDNKIILQQREDKPGLINSGLISMFGGTLNAGESVLSGLFRELSEELRHDFRDYRPSFLRTLYKTLELDGIDYTIHIYIIKNVDQEKLDLQEGEGFVVDYIPNLLAKKYIDPDYSTCAGRILQAS